MNETILLIEDNEQNRYLATFILEKSGYTVTGVRTGRDGIEAARDMAPSIILLDIQLPDLDGYAVARELRKDQALAGVPIVAITSFAMVGDREKTLEAGCTGYIEKPIDPARFVAQIEVHMNRNDDPPEAGRD